MEDRKVILASPSGTFARRQNDDTYKYQRLALGLIIKEVELKH